MVNIRFGLSCCCMCCVSIHYPTSSPLSAMLPKDHATNWLSTLEIALQSLTLTLTTEHVWSEEGFFFLREGTFIFIPTSFFTFVRKSTTFNTLKGSCSLLHQQTAYFFLLSAAHTILWVLSVLQPNFHFTFITILFGFAQLLKVMKKRKQGDGDSSCIKGHEPAFNPIRH